MDEYKVYISALPAYGAQPHHEGHSHYWVKRGGLVTKKGWGIKTWLESAELWMSVVLQEIKVMWGMEPSCPGEFASTSLGKRTGTRSKYIEKSNQVHPTHASKYSWENFIEKLDLSLFAYFHLWLCNKLCLLLFC